MTVLTHSLMNVLCVVIDHFCCRQQFFHNFSLTTLMTHGKIRVDDKKSPTRKVVDYTLIRVSWAASGSLLKFPFYDFNDYDDNWGRF